MTLAASKQMQNIIIRIAKKHDLDLTQPEQALRLDMPGYQRLCIETVRWDDLIQVSVAHYFEQNGDLIADPDIIFWVDEGKWIPSQITMSLTGWEQLVWFAEGKPTQSRKRSQRSAAQFANTWARNIRDQGWLQDGIRHHYR